MPAEKVEVLRPKLEEARKALDAALDEACQTDIEGAGSADLIRLEESLTVAREAARTVIAALQRLHGEPREDQIQQDAHRIFVDDRGVQWDAFAVYPALATTGRSSLPPPYDKGWLSMQCPEGIRRLTPIPEEWRQCSREAFCQLLDKAVVVPRRTPQAKDRADERQMKETT
jgi:uncharacterized protein (UPF0335 family)